MGSVELRKRGVDPKRLTDKMRQFAYEYPIDFNGVRAVIAAGYSKNGAAVRACKLLKNPLVRAAIGKAVRERLDQTNVDADRVLKEVIYCALRDPIDLCDEQGRIRVNSLENIPEQTRRCIDGIKCKQHTDRDGNVTQEIELKLVSKISALDLLAKYFGLLQPERGGDTNIAILNWDGLVSGNGESRKTIDVDPIEERIAEESKK